MVGVCRRPKCLKTLWHWVWDVSCMFLGPVLYPKCWVTDWMTNELMWMCCRNTGLVRVGLVRHVTCSSIVRTPARAAAAFTGHVITWTSTPGNDDGSRRSHGASPRHVRTADNAGPSAAFRRWLHGTCTGHTRPIIETYMYALGPPVDRPISRSSY